MRALSVCLWTSLTLALCACDRQPTAQSTPATESHPAPKTTEELPVLKVLSKTLSETQTNCTKNCATANAKTVYLGAPDDWLNPIINSAMLQLAEGNGEQSAKGQTLPQLLKAFVREDTETMDADLPAYDMSIETNVVRQHGALLVLGLSGSYYTGGAHGAAVQRYLVADRQARRVLTLKDVLLPKQQDALSALAYDQFVAWVKQDDPTTDMASYQKMWPFHVADEWWLSKDGLVLAYGQYDIGPYAAGMPELVIPYAQLSGILKPRYLPTVALS